MERGVSGRKCITSGVDSLGSFRTQRSYNYSNKRGDNGITAWLKLHLYMVPELVRNRV